MTLLFSLLRLMLDVILLVCRLLAWLVLRLCWLLEAALDHLELPEHAPAAPLSPSAAWARYTTADTFGRSHAIADARAACLKRGVPV